MFIQYATIDDVRTQLAQTHLWAALTDHQRAKLVTWLWSGDGKEVLTKLRQVETEFGTGTIEYGVANDEYEAALFAAAERIVDETAGE